MSTDVACGTVPARVTRTGGAVQRFDEPKLAYKQVLTDYGRTVATLSIPTGGRVVYPTSPGSSWNNTKIRVDGAVVLSLDNGELVGYSLRDNETRYRVGEYVTPGEFDPDPSTVDAPGIHCFPHYEAASHWNGYEVPE